MRFEEVFIRLVAASPIVWVISGVANAFDILINEVGMDAAMAAINQLA